MSGSVNQCAVQTFGSSEKVIGMTLSLFKELTAGYMSGKILSKLNASTFLLQDHNPATYTFLANLTNARNRTMFYATLARMIFVEDSPIKFKAFISPLQQVCIACAVCLPSDGLYGAACKKVI